jgi:hypothetical protein
MSVFLAIYVNSGDNAGTIIRTVKCSETVAGLQTRAGEAAIEIPRGTIFNDVTHKVDLATLEIVPVT